MKNLIYINLFFWSACCFVLQAKDTEGKLLKLKPVLEKHCLDCHDEDTTKGDLDLTPFLQEFAHHKDKDMWVNIEEKIRRKTMPPKKKDPLSKQDLAIVKNWFEKEYILYDGIQHAGSTSARRLTRSELQNTLEDLLHIELRPKISTDLSVSPFRKSTVARLLPADILGKSGFSNDYKSLSSSKLNMKKYLQCYEICLSYLDNNKEAREALFGTVDLPLKMSKTEISKVIGDFLKDAFRRKATAEEIKLYQQKFNGFYQAEDSVYQSLKSTFITILLSPSFLYRIEETTLGQSKVSDRELATRLAYFIWSSKPDNILVELADKGELSKPAILKQQIQRLLSSPKRIALSENMAAEWFGFFKLADNDIEKHTKIRFHRRLDPTRTMYEESILFFDSLIRYNRPLLEIVDSRWAPSNRGNKKELAVTSLGPISMYYRKMSRKVDIGTFEFAYKPVNSFKAVNDPDFGGMITTGSTLTMTSSKNETSPILRGVWVLENILGMHFKVPANIPALKKDEKRSAIDAVKLHAADKKCAHCHKYIDPIGFSLETFDQFGNKRKKVTQVIAKLPNGEEFKTPAELKKSLLKNYHDDVVENVIKRFLSYALGRQIEPVDRPAIEKIKEELTKQQFGIARLIELVATSYPFLHKEGGDK